LSNIIDDSDADPDNMVDVGLQHGRDGEIDQVAFDRLAAWMFCSPFFDEERRELAGSRVLVAGADADGEKGLHGGCTFRG